MVVVDYFKKVGKDLQKTLKVPKGTLRAIIMVQSLYTSFLIKRGWISPKKGGLKPFRGVVNPV